MFERFRPDKQYRCLHYWESRSSFWAVFGGFLLERGNPWVLVQPAEILIICGAGVGIIMVSNPPSLIRKMREGDCLDFPPALSGSRLLPALPANALRGVSYSQRTRGMGGIEADVEDPESSRIFSNYRIFSRTG